jgi:hypothetical protein
LCQSSMGQAGNGFTQLATPGRAVAHPRESSSGYRTDSSFQTEHTDQSVRALEEVSAIIDRS